MSKVPNHNQESEITDDLEMLDEYDFSKGVRGKHYLPNVTAQPVVMKITSEGDRYVTMRIVEVKAVITSDGKLTAQVPPDIIPGEHRVVLRIEQPANPLNAEISNEVNSDKDAD